MINDFVSLFLRPIIRDETFVDVTEFSYTEVTESSVLDEFIIRRKDYIVEKLVHYLIFRNFLDYSRIVTSRQSSYSTNQFAQICTTSQLQNNLLRQFLASFDLYQPNKQL